MPPTPAPHRARGSPPTPRPISRRLAPGSGPGGGGGRGGGGRGGRGGAGRRARPAARAARGSGRADVFGEQFSARTRVHEYGGGVFAVLDGDVVFSNDADGRVYRVRPRAAPSPLTPDPAAPRSLRYADFAARPDGTQIYCVR